MNRRGFLKTSGGVAMGAGIATDGLASAASASRSGPASLEVRENRIHIDTSTQTATIEKGFLISLKSKSTGEEFIKPFDTSASAALELLYPHEETVRVDESKFGSITTRQLSPTMAEIVFHSWDADGVINVCVEPETGDILVEPSAYSSRPGVMACRWNVAGLQPGLELVAPFFQGLKLGLDDSLIANTQWSWPMHWEAGLAILQSLNGGFWVHAQDNRFRFKGLKVGTETESNRLGFDTDTYGPIDGNLSAGGLVWRVNVFNGDWKVPAAEYRDWLWRAYDLAKEEERRQEWFRDVSLAVSWCPTDGEILDALVKELNPKRVLLHIPNWRTDPYDENYPNYVASSEGQAFVRKGQEMGFRMMPHFNSIDMDPSHPAYDYIRDFQLRGIERQDLRGWSWLNGRGLGVPESNASRLHNRDKKVMVKVHPGLSMWRSILADSMLQAVRSMNLDIVFIDVTLHTHNLHNCFVENTTLAEGMKRLINQVGSLGNGLVVGGEGLNELTMQGQSFAQAHLFKSWQSSVEGLERSGGCALNEFLFGKLCRTIGYSGLGGKNEDQETRMRVHLEHGTIPTVTIGSAAEITSPNKAVKEMLDRAKG